jgi:hypothetical protein
MIPLHNICQARSVQVTNVGMCAKRGNFYHVYLSKGGRL